MSHVSTRRITHPDADTPAISLREIRHRFGHDAWSFERTARFIQRLIDEHGFPRPYPYPRGTALIERATVRSTWPRIAVKSWFDDFLPTDAHAAIDQAARAAAAADMDNAAANLRVIVGGRA